jgi:tetratricopeptide (TPR) repeat protein
VKIVSQSHITEAEIEQAVRGDLEVSEVRRIVRHLCQCRGCREQQRPRLSWLGAVLCAVEPAPVSLDAATEAAYDGAIDGALAKAAQEIPRRQKHREKVARLIAWQRELPPYRLDDFSLWLGPRGSNPPTEVLIEAFLAASQEMRYRDPQAMLTLASVAADVACWLSRPGEAKDMTPAQVTDLRVRVLAELANAHRLNDEFDTADSTIDEALQALGSVGSGDLMLRNRLYDVRASLRMDQRRLGEALDLLDLIHTSYLEMGEKHLAGRALISQGIATSYMDNPREAVRFLRKGLGLIDAFREPMLAVNGQYEMLVSLEECGDYQEASRLLLQSSLRQDYADDPLNLLKLRWLEGRIFLGVKKHRRAEEILSEVRRAFARRGREYEAALVGLELAVVYLRQRKAGQAETLAEEALETFQDLKVAHEARKAVVYLREACRQKVASAAMVQEILRFLKKLERDPTLRFVPA